MYALTTTNEISVKNCQNKWKVDRKQICTNAHTISLMVETYVPPTDQSNTFLNWPQAKILDIWNTWAPFSLFHLGFPSLFHLFPFRYAPHPGFKCYITDYIIQTRLIRTDCIWCKKKCLQLSLLLHQRNFRKKSFLLVLPYIY